MHMKIIKVLFMWDSDICHKNSYNQNLTLKNRGFVCEVFAFQNWFQETFDRISWLIIGLFN